MTSTFSFARVARLFVEPLRAWRRSHVTYRELMSLDSRQLADIGLSRAEIEDVELVGRPPSVRGFASTGRPANLNQRDAA
jgi:uncharacterized protein YjiS (DUF1127 family)